MERRDFYTRFKPIGEEPLAEGNICVRLPAKIDALIKAKLTSKQRADWLRKVISEAALRDLSEASEWDRGTEG
jgi:hypothetical protein